MMNMTLDNKTYTFNKSQELFKRAATLIPCGIYGHYSPAPLVPATSYPFYTKKALGSKIWDVDDNEFIDYMCAYGPMIHGYSNKKIDNAAKAELDNGNCTTGAPPIMIDLAEFLVDITQGVDWAFFAKNGADITNYAVMIARAATARKKILNFNGSYHGTSPWMQAAGHPGQIEEDYENIIRITWNDIASFKEAVEKNRGSIAALIASPYLVPTFNDNELPAEGYWKEVSSICKKEGIILISDDIRHGFRIDIRGSHAKYGYEPDLVCYCKAIANGYPISALLGTDALKGYAANIFHTGSYWFQSEPMAAALATLKEHVALDTPSIVSAQGQKLCDGLSSMASTFGYNMVVSGDPAMPYLRISNDDSLMLHQDWCSEATKRGAFFTSHHNWFLSTAHSNEDIQKTLNIAEDAFKAVKEIYGDEYTG
ncbi:MAG: aminotransferase class III-fold pyridoxal phosphate-dependent enzyme [Bacteroidales bacterium]|jgi:glutamate-1-semialdehyde 2,1-aminomutase|nr:aminotransferase class III-fold pyridoxal phosphate-dependent enzyme [Bacteroidales bacterium]